MSELLPAVLVNLRDIESETPSYVDIVERYGLVLYPENGDQAALYADWCENRAREADANGDKERGLKFWRLVRHYDDLWKGRSS